MKTYPRVLTIAGSDSGGGAGIQADIKAISATGSYAASAITAVTVRSSLDAFGITNVVLDPVMVATSGDRLIDEDAVKVLAEELAPYVRVITPNIPEAEILAGVKISSQDELPLVGRQLSERLSSVSGRKVSVLMKAGHLEDDELVDYFYNAEEDHTVELRSKRVFSRNTHGTGCTLSSAFASYLAQGCGPDEAASRAKAYISAAIEVGAEYIIGGGHGPVCHFYGLPGR